MRTEDKVTLHAELESATVTGLSQLLSKISEDTKIGWSQLEVGTGDSSVYLAGRRPLPATEPLFHTELPASTMFHIIYHRQAMGHPDTPDCSLFT